MPMQRADRPTAPDNRLDFLIIGAQKSGTTALAAYLAQHPGIFIPPQKELHFFRRPIGDGPIPRYDRFHRKFEPHLGCRACGEASPLYLYWPRSLELIRDYRPDIKLIAVLRNPVVRAYSAWSMERRRERETLDFSDAIRSGRDRVTRAEGGVHLTYSYVERGFYGAQLEHALNLFPRDQICVLRSEEVTPEGPGLQRALTCLGVAPFAFERIDAHLTPGSLPPTPGLEDDFAWLHELYLEDLRKLAALDLIPVEDWLAGPPPLPDPSSFGPANGSSSQ